MLETAKFVANLREMPFEDLVKTTDENAKKFFIFGATFCAMSFFVPIKLYYTIFGCLMLITSVVLTFFGKKTTE